MAERLGAYSKFMPPVLTDVLVRPRLFSRLEQYAARQATWVVGPPGAGKTTLVASYIENKRYIPFWFQVEAGDAEPATFFSYLNTAAKQIANVDSSRLPNFTPEYALGLRTFAGRYFETFYTLLPAGTTVVFDGYHEAENEDRFTEIMRVVVAKITPGLRLIIMSRNQPPAAFARAQANREIGVLDWNTLRFNDEESDEWLMHRGIEQVEYRRQIAQAASGWVAGLVLLEQSAHIEDSSGLDTTDYQLVFDYFAAEILADYPEHVQLLILQTALLPRMSVDNCARLTSTDATVVATILEMLYRNHHFIERRREDEFQYQYHPLFRRYLLNDCRQRVPAEQLQTLKRHAAGILLEDAQYEAAAELLIQSQGWPLLIGLCIEQAPLLLRSGRNRVLLSWIASIPGESAAEFPDLQLWRAQALLAYDPAGARTLFAESFQHYRDSNIVPGLYAAWSGIIQTYTVEWDDFSSMDTWLDEFKNVQAAGAYPSASVEAGVLGALITCLMWRRASDAGFDGVSARASVLLNELDDVNQQVMLAAQLLWFFQFTGEIPRAMRIMAAMQQRALHDSVLPIVRIIWHNTVSAWAWFNGNHEASAQHYRQSMTISTTTGIHVLDDMIYAQETYNHLLMGDAAAARAALKMIEVIIQPERRLGLAHYYYQCGWEKILSGELHAALNTLHMSLELTRQLGTPIPETLVSYLLCMVQLELGEFTSARKFTDELQRLAEITRSNLAKLELYMAQACLEQKTGSSKECVISIRRAVNFARMTQFTDFPGRISHQLAPLYAIALQADIETDYVRKLIQVQNIKPDALGLTLENWPWQVRIHTLGKFTIEVDEALLSLSGRQRRRPLGLLCLLLVHRDRPLNIETIVDHLWPDCEWEKGQNAFKANLARLRKLVGKQTIRQAGGKISLNTDLCWVDAWSVSDLVEQIDKNNDIGTKLKLCERMMLYYSGCLLEANTDYWIIRYRDELRKKYLGCLLKAARMLQQSGSIEESLKLCEAGLKVEPAGDAFFDCMIQDLLASGRFAEVVTTYQRYRQRLESVGAKPNEKIVELCERAVVKKA